MEKQEVKLSIIMCAYNSEKYIERSIRSVINQIFKDYELIIINDGSNDKTLDIIKSIEDRRIKIINNKVNMGASFSRNEALNIAIGDYIGFIDSDDAIDDNYYELMIKSIVENNADIVVCDIKSVQDNNQESLIKLVKCCDGGFKKENLINNGYASSSCNKLFKKSIITKYLYPNGKTAEDIAVVLPAIYNSNKIAYVNDCCYYYYQHNSSTQNQKFSDKRFDVFDTVEIALSRMKKCSDDIKQSIIFNQIVLLLFYSLININDLKERYFFLKKFSNLCNKYNMKNNKYLINFLAKQGKYHRIFYKLLINLISLHAVFLSNILILLMHFYQKNYVKNVIKANIGINELIKESKKQQSLKKINFSISVVIPNYNYSRFLYQRLYSILNQNVKISEIIILDDCSTDDSRNVIDNIVDALSKYINIKKIYNTNNSGSAFKQWEKGFNVALGDYIWIAEADDYCDSSFLHSVIKPMKKNKDILISYCDTAFINSSGKIIYKSVRPDIDLMKTGHWNHNYVNDGIDEIKNYAFLNCTIANVSSVIFKKHNYKKELSESGKFKQAGDWLFYINVMLHGKIAYCNRTLNYYRIHDNNVTAVTKKVNHFNEIKRVHKFIDQKINLDINQKKMIKKRYNQLSKEWNLNKEGASK